MTTLRDASLADIARELRRRAKRTCSFCGGSESTATAPLACSQCGSSGYELRPELEAAAAQLEVVVTGTISIGRHSWPFHEPNDSWPVDHYRKVKDPIMGW